MKNTCSKFLWVFGARCADQTFWNRRNPSCRPCGFFCELSLRPSLGSNIPNMENPWLQKKLDDGWPESEKDVFQAALRMVVVKYSRWIVGEFYMSYGKIWCEKVRLIKKRIFGKGHQMTCVLQRQRERGGRDKERERKREREKEKARERENERGR